MLTDDDEARLSLPHILFGAWFMQLTSPATLVASAASYYDRPLMRQVRVDWARRRVLCRPRETGWCRAQDEEALNLQGTIGHEAFARHGNFIPGRLTRSVATAGAGGDEDASPQVFLLPRSIIESRRLIRCNEVPV